LNWSDLTDLLITGGGRGITALCAQALPLQNKTLWICGRTPRLAPQSEWSQQDQTYIKALKEAKTPQEEIKNLLKAHAHLDLPSLPLPQFKKIHKELTAQLELEAHLVYFKSLGAHVEYLSVDVAHPESITQAIQKRDPSALSRIQGVIHGAGILNDSYFIKKEWIHFNQVLQVKTALLLWIQESLPALRLLVGFSSVSAALGNQGQTDYACANAMIDAYIEKRTRCSSDQSDSAIYGLSLQWGPWSGAGMVSDSLEAYYQKAGIRLIPAQEGQDAFREDILCLNPQKSGVFLRSFPFAH
jgi:NAD(P)-dependent dehydrogenase (short-subunit alcohol dehydrogenase family)